MPTFLTINPTFRAISGLKDFHKIEEKVKFLASYESLPKISIHPEASVRSMGDSGVNWVMIQKKGEDFYEGVNAVRELDSYESRAIELIAKAQKISL